ncbi:MAG: VOC family protein [Hyphomicrobiales bacterium]|nr:MAG: VOC family protein [Hyphomicrobiales bacterium]
MLTVSSIAHVAIRVKDVEKSLDFYVNKLGFKEMMRLDRDGKLWLVYLRVTDDQFLEIFPDGEGGPQVAHETVGYNHMCFAVPDIDQCVREIEAAGIPFYRPKTKQVDNNWQCWIRDPDEHRIELMQMADDSLQGAAIARLRTL